MRIYLSGKMTGLPLMNYPAFHAEADRLRALGYEVANPAENQQQDSWAAYMKQACAQMLTCDAIAVLPNWSLSKGARIEVQLAIQCGMAFFRAADIQAPAKVPSRPKLDFVVSCAVVLVNSIPDSAMLVEIPGTQNVAVNSDLLADLVSAVREMQAGSKPLEELDAYKQLDLMEATE